MPIVVIIIAFLLTHIPGLPPLPINPIHQPLHLH